jgi:hypothetical protein
MSPSDADPGRTPNPRHPLRPRLAGWLTAVGLPDRAPAVVLDVSARECGFFLIERLKRGESVGLELAVGPASLRRLVVLRVTEVRPVTGGFEVVAEFGVPLTGGELQALFGGR